MENETVIVRHRFIILSLMCDIIMLKQISVGKCNIIIRCNPMHPHYCALPGLFVPVRVTRATFV